MRLRFEVISGEAGMLVAKLTIKDVGDGGLIWGGRMRVRMKRDIY